jgi:hypothetical protein
MRFALAIALLFSAVYANPTAPPCGQSDPPGVCATKSQCEKAGGFYVARDCAFYDGLVGCCYKAKN